MIALKGLNEDSCCKKSCKILYYLNNIASLQLLIFNPLSVLPMVIFNQKEVLGIVNLSFLPKNCPRFDLLVTKNLRMTSNTNLQTHESTSKANFQPSMSTSNGLDEDYR